LSFAGQAKIRAIPKRKLQLPSLTKVHFAATKNTEAVAEKNINNGGDYYSIQYTPFFSLQIEGILEIWVLWRRVSRDYKATQQKRCDKKVFIFK
jgi:hypothetical protein